MAAHAIHRTASIADLHRFGAGVKCRSSGAAVQLRSVLLSDWRTVLVPGRGFAWSGARRGGGWAMNPYLLVSGDFTTWGGMDRANYALADYLARQGNEVHLVAHRVAPGLSERPNVIFHRVPKIL